MIVGAAQNEYGKLVVWSLILIVVVIVGFVLATWARRRLHHQDTTPSMGFSLADLRELHRTGKISDEEFEKARGRMAASLKRQVDQKPKKSE